MPTVTLHLGEHGKLEGLSERDRKAYAKFHVRLKSLGNESITFTWREPRSGPYHRRFFLIFDAVMRNQDQFDQDKHLLDWLKVGAGYATLVPGPRGKQVAIADSINWETLDQAEFEPIAMAIWAFLRSQYATRFLWPMLDDIQGMAMVDTILAEFGE